MLALISPVVTIYVPSFRKVVFRYKMTMHETRKEDSFCMALEGPVRPKWP